MLGRWLEGSRFWVIEKLHFKRKEIYYLVLALVCALVSVGLVFHKFSSFSQAQIQLQAKDVQKRDKHTKTIEFITEKDVKILEF